jgi:hypothetical protein
VTVVEVSGGVARRSGDRGGAVVRGIGGVAKVEWLGAIGGVIQLTLHGSGLTNAACAQFEVFCNRCILPLCRSS